MKVGTYLIVFPKFYQSKSVMTGYDHSSVCLFLKNLFFFFVLRTTSLTKFLVSFHLFENQFFEFMGAHNGNFFFNFFFLLVKYTEKKPQKSVRSRRVCAETSEA